MTTSVQLPAAHAGPSAPAEEEARPGGIEEAMGAFPSEMQRYMQAEGFALPTPIQQQCAVVGLHVSLSRSASWA